MDMDDVAFAADAINVVRGAGWQQEWYETASGTARRRARVLRHAGYRVSVQSMGMQVTSLGRMALTLVDVRGSRE